jgi:hypothetical protein
LGHDLIVQFSEACQWALIMGQVRNEFVMDKNGDLAELNNIWHK